MNVLVATLLIVAAAQLAAILTLSLRPQPTAWEQRFPVTVHALCLGTALLVWPSEALRSGVCSPRSP